MSWIAGLAGVAGAAALTWVASLRVRKISIVDTVWPLLFLLQGLIYAAGPAHPRTSLVLALLVLWSLRLAAYLAWRNWGEPEDRRYETIRRRNEPNFAWKSLYLVFLLQAALAWIVGLPLFGALRSPTSMNALDGLGALLVLAGIAFESIGDWQLARFKSDPANAGQVLDRGLWRYTRHPNYFGDFVVWWGFWIIACAARAPWSIAGPILMSVLLMRVSGVRLLEGDIGERRPAYVDYIRRTPAFFPGRPRRGAIVPPP